MKLVIVSHTEHHVRDGEIVGWGPTVREISHLAGMFDQVHHIAMLYDQSDSVPQGEIPYEAKNVRLIALKPSGGTTLWEKLGILLAYPRYAAVILRELADADVVHVRAPANIALLAILLLPFLRRPTKRWIKYAGNWKPDGGESWSYTLQRWLLMQGWHRGEVTVNGKWEGDPAFVHSFINPCLTDEELAEGITYAAGKTLTTPPQLLLVGTLARSKGVERALQVLAKLKESGVDVKLGLIGDGKERLELEDVARSLNVMDDVTFHGWMSRHAVSSYYAQAHLLLFPTRSEGWPKVISEAMAYGVVPLSSAVSSIPQYLDEFRVGMALPPKDIDAFASGVRAYLDDPERWADESKRAVEAAARFTYSRFLQDVRDLLNLT